MWNHHAVVREGTKVRTFLNGVVQTEGTVEAGDVFGGTNTIIRFGSAGPGANSANIYYGYFDMIRVVKGTAIYTGQTSFTPPTSY